MAKILQFPKQYANPVPGWLVFDKDEVEKYHGPGYVKILQKLEKRIQEIPGIQIRLSVQFEDSLLLGGVKTDTVTISRQRDPNPLHVLTLSLDEFRTNEGPHFWKDSAIRNKIFGKNRKFLRMVEEAAKIFNQGQLPAIPFDYNPAYKEYTLQHPNFDLRYPADLVTGKDLMLSAMKYHDSQCDSNGNPP